MQPPVVPRPGALPVHRQTLTEAGGLVRIYEGTNVYLYDGDDFSHAEGIDTRFTVTGIDTSVKPHINEETVRRIAIKAANQFSEPCSVTLLNLVSGCLLPSKVDTRNQSSQKMTESSSVVHL